MKLFLLLFLTITSFSNQLYINTFGDKNDKPIIFLHGGPGYNCANFEATTAQSLSEEGFYVICYDRRGEGRSSDQNAKYTFEESLNDMLFIMDSLEISSTDLIGHSFGGMLAIKFAEQYPDRTNEIFLVGAPINLQDSFKNIIYKSRKIYEDKGDNANLNYLKMLESMDSSSIEYSSYSFMHAMQNGFYTPSEMTDEAKKLYKDLRSKNEYASLSMNMTQEAPRGFWENENYTTIDLTNNLDQIVKGEIKVTGIYGVDDGLYSKSIVGDIENIIGTENMNYLENSSHSVYIDRQKEFIKILKGK